MADGDVELTIGSGEGERKVILRSTPRAARKVSDTFNGIGGAFPRLAAFDLAAFSAVVAAGLSTKAKAVAPADVEDDVYAAGLVNLMDPLLSYLSLLSNGGRPVETDTKEKDDKPGEA